MLTSQAPIESRLLMETQTLTHLSLASLEFRLNTPSIYDIHL
jgi:hypothetical protein